MTALSSQVDAFIDACAQCSVSELRQALKNGPDMTDMRTWGITAREWSGAINLALSIKED